MTEDQLCRLSAFARGDTNAQEFEKWFFTQGELEAVLGEDLHWSLASANYSERDGVWKLRQSLAQWLAPFGRCQCPSLRNLSAVPMGGDGLDERVFDTVENVCKFGRDLWWLYLSKCHVCGQDWMVAQEERIFDEYFMRRLTPDEARQIIAGEWPAEFITYEKVLRIGRELSQPCVYFDSMSPALVETASDLRKARPEITADEIAYLLGITPKNASRLLAA